MLSHQFSIFRNGKYMFCFVLLLTQCSCGCRHNDTDNKQLNNESNCTSVDDCLDKHNFEQARKYCSQYESFCDRLKIIDIESQFWINEQEYKRAKEIALEVYSLKDKSAVEKNDFFSEKLDDIISQAVSSNRLDNALEIYADFPVDVKGDRTVVFQSASAETIATALKRANRKRDEFEFRQNQSEIKAKLNKLKSEFEDEKRAKINGLKQDIADLIAEQNAKKREGRNQLPGLRKDLKNAYKRLAEIQNGFYIFKSRRDEDISAQKSIIYGIERDISDITDVDSDYREKIKDIREEIEEIRKESFYKKN